MEDKAEQKDAVDDDVQEMEDKAEQKDVGDAEAPKMEDKGKAEQDVVDAEPSKLPLGYLKRLEVARALALKPKLLLLDEPLAGLNQSEASSLADLIKTLNQDGLSILLIEHNLREVLRICPQVYVQDLGKSLAFGNSNEIMNQPEVIKAYLGES